MAKLVVLSEGLTGRSYELKVERTTVGRLEDNAFQIPESSVSSHHCEIVLRGTDVVVKDLGSTNGTFVNGQQVKTEAVVKAGQILRLGQIEMRLEDENQQAPKKLPDKTMVIPQGVKRTELDHGTRSVAFDKNSPFSKKSNTGTKLFIAVAVIVVVGILVAIAYAIKSLQSGS
jgi:pSer/pThr/pTyr-binding forkhead associated (FHA) protein